METEEIKALIQKIENASSLIELTGFLQKLNAIIKEWNDEDWNEEWDDEGVEVEDWMDINDFIDLDKLPVFSDTCPDNVDFLSDDCDVKSYDETQLLCFDGLYFRIEEREYFNE